MNGEIRHLTGAGRVLRFFDSPNVYSVNGYQSLVLATGSEVAARLLAERSARGLKDLRAWEPCCGGAQWQ